MRAKSWTCVRRFDRSRDCSTISFVEQPLRLPFSSERLDFRGLRESDIDEHARLFANPHVMRFLYDEPLDAEAARQHLALRVWAGLAKQGGWANLAVEREGGYLGEIGVGLVSSVDRTCEIGYVFLPEAGGHGYATEAARVAVDIALTFHRAQRVVARLDARNSASIRLLERLGMRREAHFRRNEFVKGEWCDELVYAVLSDDWTVTTRFE